MFRRHAFVERLFSVGGLQGEALSNWDAENSAAGATPEPKGRSDLKCPRQCDFSIGHVIKTMTVKVPDSVVLPGASPGSDII